MGETPVNQSSKNYLFLVGHFFHYSCPSSPQIHFGSVMNHTHVPRITTHASSDFVSLVLLDESCYIPSQSDSCLPCSTQTSQFTLPRPGVNRQLSNLSTIAATGFDPGHKSTKSKGKRSLGRVDLQPSWRLPPYSNGVQTSFNWRSGRPMAGMLELERSRTRRERTFIGSECAVCEEPLEHTLRGERILQFSCGHVSHEACFYEYIKEFESQYCPTCNAPLGLDTSRGGNVLDLGTVHVPRLEMKANNIPEKLSSIVRSVSQNNQARDQQQQRSTQENPMPWDSQTIRDRPRSRDSNNRFPQRDSRESQQPPRDSRESQRERIERYGSGARPQHARNGSAGTGAASSGDYNDPQANNGGRRHDYDVQSMETDLSSPRASITRNPIPAPTVTVRSEYPTLNRSRQQQSLTCLITIEVPEGNWRPDPEDLRGASQLPSMQQDPGQADPKSPAPSRQGDWPFEAPEVLEEITEDLRARVDNWHGLDFTRHVSETFALHVLSPNCSQVRKTASVWHRASWKRSAFLAGTRMLSLRRNVDMREGEERRHPAVCRRQFQAQTYQMHSERVHFDQEALEAGGVERR